MSGPARMLDAGQRARFEAAAAELPKPDRDIFLARMIEGKSFDEIATATGLSKEEAMRLMAHAHVTIAPLVTAKRAAWWQRRRRKHRRGSP